MKEIKLRSFDIGIFFKVASNFKRRHRTQEKTFLAGPSKWLNSYKYDQLITSECFSFATRGLISERHGTNGKAGTQKSRRKKWWDFWPFNLPLQPSPAPSPQLPSSPRVKRRWLWDWGSVNTSWQDAVSASTTSTQKPEVLLWQWSDSLADKSLRHFDTVLNSKKRPCFALSNWRMCLDWA